MEDLAVTTDISIANYIDGEIYSFFSGGVAPHEPGIFSLFANGETLYLGIASFNLAATLNLCQQRLISCIPKLTHFSTQQEASIYMADNRRELLLFEKALQALHIFKQDHHGEIPLYNTPRRDYGFWNIQTTT